MLSNIFTWFFRRLWYYKEVFLLSKGPYRYRQYFLYKFFNKKKKADSIYPLV